MIKPTILEQNFLVSFLLLNYFNSKINEYCKNNKIIREEKIRENLPFNILFSIIVQSSIICARKLYEANHKFGLTESDWKKLRELRNSFLHAKTSEDQEIREIASVKEVYNILLKLFNFISKQNDLKNNKVWKSYKNDFFIKLDKFLKSV